MYTHSPISSPGTFTLGLPNTLHILCITPVTSSLRSALFSPSRWRRKHHYIYTYSSGIIHLSAYNIYEYITRCLRTKISFVSEDIIYYYYTRPRRTVIDVYTITAIVVAFVCAVPGAPRRPPPQVPLIRVLRALFSHSSPESLGRPRGARVRRDGLRIIMTRACMGALFAIIKY